MRKLLFPVLLCLASGIAAPVSSHASGQQQTETIPLVDRAHAQEWSTDINEGWRSQPGDNLAWAQPGFDDSAWQPVELDDLGIAQPGWRWFRLHLHLHEDHPDLTLLVLGGEGTYELYVNGARVPETRLLSPFAVSRPTERAVSIAAPGTDLVLAMRTHAPTAYVNWHLPIFLGVTLGTPAAIDNAREAFQSGRMNAALPVIVINLLLMLSGLAAFGLYRSQLTHPEYFWLGIYLFAMGLSDMLWGCQVAGVAPLAGNFVVADPLIYIFTIAQIQFTFSFGGRRVGRAWRVYQAVLLAPLALIWFTWHNLIPSHVYLFIEALIVIPVALLLPILLFVWYRRGNREAGWLVLPSLLPAATVTLGNLGSISIFLGWHSLDFFDNTIPIGHAQLQVDDAGNLLYLFAIAIVMFFRFTRVSREQARASAELEAAREIQQQLVPHALPRIAGFSLQAAFLPAQEVGGDFYQIFPQTDGSTLIVVGDVSGKGLKAAMTGTLAIGALRTLAAARLGPAAILAQLNSQMVDSGNGGFITCLCLHLRANGSAVIANAGHLAPYRNGEEIPSEPALPLGLAPDAAYAEFALQLDSGDALTLLSDGVVEATNATGELFGFERTRQLSTQSADRIAAAACQFGQEDDITVLTLQRD